MIATKRKQRNEQQKLLNVKVWKEECPMLTNAKGSKFINHVKFLISRCRQKKCAFFPHKDRINNNHQTIFITNVPKSQTILIIRDIVFYLTKWSCFLELYLKEWWWVKVTREETQCGGIKTRFSNEKQIKQRKKGIPT